MEVVGVGWNEGVFFVQFLLWDPSYWQIIRSDLRISVPHMTEFRKSYCLFHKTPIMSHIVQPSFNPFGVFFCQVFIWSFSVTPHCALRSLHLHPKFLFCILSHDCSRSSVIWSPMSISFWHPWGTHRETDLSRGYRSRSGRRGRMVRWCLLAFASPSQRWGSSQPRG